MGVVVLHPDQLDALLVEALAAGRSPAELDAAVAGYLDIGGFLDDGSGFGVYSRLNLYAAAGRAAALSRAKP